MAEFRGLDDTNKLTAREIIVPSRTSVAGPTTLATLKTIAGIPIDLFDELILYKAITTALVGTAPTLDIYFQSSPVAAPDPAVDAHWDDFAKFIQSTQATGLAAHILPLVAGVMAAAASSTVAMSHVRGAEQAGFVAGNQFPYHWGDQLRIREVEGGTVTTHAVYSIHAVGIRRK